MHFGLMRIEKNENDKPYCYRVCLIIFQIYFYPYHNLKGGQI